MGGGCPPFDPSTFIFPERYEKRLEVLTQYETLKLNGTDEELCELFGIKETREHERYKLPFSQSATMKAIERYDGVAYDYLSYESLTPKAREFIDRNVILFSNLFGPIGAGDCIPDYKLKQGSSIGAFAPERFYKEHFSADLDEMIGDQEVLDLRAGFYDKFYVPKSVPTVLKFLKEGKVVSHWAKAYRGIVLREAALNGVASIDELLALNIEGLMLHEIIETKKKKEVIYTIR